MGEPNVWEDQTSKDPLLRGSGEIRSFCPDGLVVRAVGKVSESYKIDRSAKHTFKPHGAVVYDHRNLTIKGAD